MGIGDGRCRRVFPPPAEVVKELSGQIPPEGTAAQVPQKGSPLSIILGSLICILGGVGVGSFLLPLKYSKSWRWENSWLVGAFFMYVLFPWLSLLVLVPNFGEIYARTSGKDLAMIYLFGLIQGSGSYIFTYGTTLLGIGLGYALMIGCIALFGLLVPLFGAHLDRVAKLDGITLLIGCAILTAGLAFSGKAGLEREAAKATVDAKTSRKKLSITRAVFVVLWAGIANAMFYFTFEFQRSMKDMAIHQYHIPAYAWGFLNVFPFFLGMFTTNFLLTFVKMLRDGTLKNYRSAPGLGREYLLAVAIAIPWYLGQGVGYTAAQAILGPLGVAVGAALFMGAIVIVSAALGVATGEWQGAPSHTMRTLYLALFLLVAAMSVISIGNYLQQVVLSAVPG
jgi:L-rhamnose-H+ transport protein